MGGKSAPQKGKSSPSSLFTQESAKSLTAALQVVDEARSAFAIADDDLRARVRDAVTAEVVETYEVRSKDEKGRRACNLPSAPIHPLTRLSPPPFFPQLLLTAVDPALLKYLHYTAADARALVEGTDFFVLRDDAARAGGNSGLAGGGGGGGGGASFKRR